MLTSKQVSNVELRTSLAGFDNPCHLESQWQTGKQIPPLASHPHIAMSIRRRMTCCYIHGHEPTCEVATDDHTRYGLANGYHNKKSRPQTLRSCNSCALLNVIYRASADASEALINEATHFHYNLHSTISQPNQIPNNIHHV